MWRVTRCLGGHTTRVAVHSDRLESREIVTYCSMPARGDHTSRLDRCPLTVSQFAPLEAEHLSPAATCIITPIADMLSFTDGRGMVSDSSRFSSVPLVPVHCALDDDLHARPNVWCS
ncbi:hypothetical protein E2C01_020671 [Portunus trituberculatus]|uniref:Uncharacterized protein n=1 Tax=Portunus trituberculatus TaxID=210409 RepID=A0A5B7E0I7_PORTR|nr:hypothetical protein [Portunus trituberculatus]